MDKKILELQQKTIEDIEDKLTELERKCELAGWRKGYDEGYKMGREDGLKEKEKSEEVSEWVYLISSNGESKLACGKCKTAYKHDLIGCGTNYCPHCGVKMFYSMKDGD